MSFFSFVRIKISDRKMMLARIISKRLSFENNWTPIKPALKKSSISENNVLTMTKSVRTTQPSQKDRVPKMRNCKIFFNIGLPYQNKRPMSLEGIFLKDRPIPDLDLAPSETAYSFERQQI